MQRMNAEFQALVCGNLRILNLVMKPESYGVSELASGSLWRLLVAHASQTLIPADITGPNRAGSLIALAACR
jgi:hypothetical protein